MPEQSLAETLKCPIEALPLTDIYAALGTQPQGLTHTEAAARLQHYGRNSIRLWRPRRSSGSSWRTLPI